MYSFLIFTGMFFVAMLAATAAVIFAWAAMQSRLGLAPQDETDQQPVEGLLREDSESISTIRIWRLLLERLSHADTIRRQISEADLDWTVGRMVLLMMMLALLTFTAFNAVSWMPILISIAAGLGAGFMPYAFVRFKRGRRLALFAAQFPEALESLARAMKAGYPLASGIELLVYEQPEPLATEMRRVREQWKLGTSWDDSLDSLANRIPIPEVGMFAAAVKLQNRVGGRLNDVLARMAETMRETGALEGEVRSITAHSRMTGAVLSAVPVVLTLTMFAVNPEYIAGLFAHPAGRLMVSVALVANVAAHFIIKKLSQVRM